MKKRIICIVTGIIMFLSGVASAANYTLPEKMQNQLTIGSGLKGSFTVTSSGELSNEPFLKAVSDAVYDLRGMSSGHDLHYYLFQENDGSQTNLAELYRKEGEYFFRSDAVQGKILGLSGLSVYLDSIFPQKGENPTLSSAIMNYFSLNEDTREKQWKPLFSRYQNELEMWLHDFTAKADVVKQENGSSAFDFSYVIPVDEIKKKMVSMFAGFAADTDLQNLLNTIMTPEQKDIYLNAALSYFYQAAVESLNIKSDVLLSKRVSALGDLISSRLVLPIDPEITGYDTVTIESSGGYSVYRLEGKDRALVIGLPDIDLLQEHDYSKSVWISRIDNAAAGENDNFSVRADIQKTFRQYSDEEEKTHQEEHYTIKVSEDKEYLPDAFKDEVMAEWHDINAEIDLHYHSKYSQNSATTLEFRLDYQQNNSSLKIDGKVKTAAPWLFMPFEVSNPVEISPDHPEITDEYITDWTSNAVSIIHHLSYEEINEPTDNGAAAAAPETEQSQETGSDVSEDAETAPLPEQNDGGEGAE